MTVEFKPSDWTQPAGSATVRTTCPYCGVGCGVLATPDGKGGAAINGDPQITPPTPAACAPRARRWARRWGWRRGCCIRSSTARAPSWDHALDHVARRLAAVRSAHGPEAIAFYLSGQLLTEDYYVANKLAKGFIGTPHVDTNSRLCMASSVAGHRRAFGADVVPQCYDDLELADLVVLAGSNAAWCHPILYQRIQTARAERGVRVVNIDPRRTATSEGADLQLSDQARHRRMLWCGPAGVARRATALIDARSSRSTRKASRGAAARPRSSRRHLDAVAARNAVSTARRLALSTAGSPARRASSPATARASTSRRRAPTRSTRSSTATSPPAASASRAPDRCRSPASPTPWAGARSAASPTCWPRTWASRRAERDRVRRFWNAPNLVDRPGPQGRRHVRCHRRRTHQGAVGDGHQPGGLAAARGRGARRRWPSSTSSSCRRTSPATTRCARRTCACPPPPGARRTARSPTRSGASRASARSCRLPGSARPRLVDPERGGAAAGLRRSVRLSLRWPRSSTSTRAFRASRTAASAPSTSPGRRPRASTPTTASSPSNGRSRDGRGADDRAVCRRRLLHAGSARPASLPSHRRALRSRRRTPGRSCSTPAAFATSGTP